MVNNEIILTFTTWKRRIGNIPVVLDSILKQTMTPGKIVLNLSSSEFQDKETDIPKNVLLFLKKNNVEINWIDGSNTRQWKKIIPTLNRYPDKWVVCIDDDRIYKPLFIEKLWKKHLDNPNNAITVNRGYRVNGCLQHCGHGTLECARFYNYFKGIDIEEIRKITESSDTMFTFFLNKFGHPLICTDADYSKMYNEIAPLSKSSGTCTRVKHLEIWNWLTKKYGTVKPQMPVIKDNNDSKDILTTMYGDVIKLKIKKTTNNLPNLKNKMVVRKFR